MCERFQRLASSAMRTSQLNQTTMINAMNTLSQNAWPFWNGPPMRCLSNPGSCHANHSVTARPPTTNSVMKIQAFGQSSVPADKNSSAPMDTIHNKALTESAHVTLGLPKPCTHKGIRLSQSQNLAFEFSPLRRVALLGVTSTNDLRRQRELHPLQVHRLCR